MPYHSFLVIISRPLYYRKLNMKNWSPLIALSLALLASGAVNAQTDQSLPPPKPPMIEPFHPEAHTGSGRLGMRIEFLKNGLPIITALTQGGPAMDFGLRVGDVILRIGKNDPLSLTKDQVKLSLHGDPGSSVELSIERNDCVKPLLIAIKRRELPTDSVDTNPPRLPTQYYHPDSRDVPSIDRDVPGVNF